MGIFSVWAIVQIIISFGCWVAIRRYLSKKQAKLAIMFAAILAVLLISMFKSFFLLLKDYQYTIIGIFLAEYIYSKIETTTIQQYLSNIRRNDPDYLDVDDNDLVKPDEIEDISLYNLKLKKQEKKINPLEVAFNEMKKNEYRIYQERLKRRRHKAINDD